VLAVDTEPASIEATLANARANAVDLTVQLVDSHARLPRAAVAVANISLEAVCELPARIDVDELVTSGYLAGRPFALAGFEPVERRVLEGWAADFHRRV